MDFIGLMVFHTIATGLHKLFFTDPKIFEKACEQRFNLQHQEKIIITCNSLVLTNKSVLLTAPKPIAWQRLAFESVYIANTNALLFK